MIEFSEYHNRYGKRLVLATPILRIFGQMRDLLKTAGIDIEMTDGWRGQAEQEADLKKHVSHAKFGESAHNFGVAFDAAPVLNGKLEWPNDEVLWGKIGAAGEKYGLEWGGSWTPEKRDLPHFDIRGWENQGLMLYRNEPPIS